MENLVEKIEKLSPKKSDILVVYIDPRAKMDAVNLIAEEMKSVDCKVLICPMNESKVEVIPSPGLGEKVVVHVDTGEMNMATAMKYVAALRENWEAHNPDYPVADWFLKNPKSNIRILIEKNK